MSLWFCTFLFVLLFVIFFHILGIYKYKKARVPPLCTVALISLHYYVRTCMFNVTKHQWRSFVVIFLNNDMF
jgi:hypothetical protein